MFYYKTPRYDKYDMINVYIVNFYKLISNYLYDKNLKNIVGNNEKVSRGCVQVQANNAQTCALANQGVAPIKCELCAKDKCNSASSRFYSILTMSLAIVLLFLFNLL